MARVSVVIPVYNTAPYLGQCLDSVLHQSLKDIEVICIDDGSTDASPQILHEYAARDPRVQVISQENAGAGVARNTGLDHAAGEYVLFLDSDDWFALDFLQRMVERGDRERADITICRAEECDTRTGERYPSAWMLKTDGLPGETFSPQRIAGSIFQFTYGWPWDKLYRRDFLKRTGVQFPGLKNSEDVVFVFQSLVLANKIAVLDQVMICHRVNRGSSVSNTRSRQPEAPYQAYRLIRDELESRGILEKYRESLQAWALDFLCWHVCSLHEEGVQKEYLSILRKNWIPSLQLAEKPVELCETKKVYAKYLVARYAPYPLLKLVLRAYRRMKNRG